MKTQLKPVEIFRAGKHTAMSGQVLEFTAEHARQIVEGYSPEVYRAPIVIGHPKIEDPAFGWVDALQLNDRGVIEARPAELEPQFAAMVQAGRFRKVSASLFTPAHPSNPKPGQYYLKHVGFLGAAAPAVPGLKPVQFAEGADELVVEFSLNDATWSIARMMRNLREFLIAKFDMETADQVIPDYLVTDTEAARRESAPPAYAAHPNEEDARMNEQNAQREKELAEKEAALKAKEAEFAARDAEIAAEKAKARRAEIAEFCAGLVKEGKLLPRDEAPMVAMFCSLDGRQVEIEFADGTEQKKVINEAWLREFLQRLPKQVDFGEHAGAEGEDAPTANFAAPAGYQVDAKRLELHRKALAYAKQHNLSYEQALAAVR